MSKSSAAALHLVADSVIPASRIIISYAVSAEGLASRGEVKDALAKLRLAADALGQVEQILELAGLIVAPGGSR